MKDEYTPIQLEPLTAEQQKAVDKKMDRIEKQIQRERKIKYAVLKILATPLSFIFGALSVITKILHLQNSEKSKCWNTILRNSRMEKCALFLSASICFHASTFYLQKDTRKDYALHLILFVTYGKKKARHP